MQYVVSFERHSLKENAISALPSLCSCPPASLPNSWVLMLFSFSGSSLVGSHSPQNVIVTCSLGGGSWWGQILCLSPLPPHLVAAQILSFTVGSSSSSRAASGCAASGCAAWAALGSASPCTLAARLGHAKTSLVGALVTRGES